MNLRFIAVAFALTALATNCSNNAPPSLTTSGKAAFESLKVVKALDVVRDVADGAKRNGVLSLESATAIVTWHRAAVQTVNAAPAGWKPTVLTGLDQVKKSLKPDELEQLRPYITLVETVIQGVVQ